MEKLKDICNYAYAEKNFILCGENGLACVVLMYATNKGCPLFIKPTKRIKKLANICGTRPSLTEGLSQTAMFKRR